MTIVFIVLLNLFVSALVYLALNLKITKMTEKEIHRKFKNDFHALIDEFNYTADMNISLLEARIHKLEKIIQAIEVHDEQISSLQDDSLSPLRLDESISVIDDKKLTKNKIQGRDLQSRAQMDRAAEIFGDEEVEFDNAESTQKRNNSQFKEQKGVTSSHGIQSNLKKSLSKIENSVISLLNRSDRQNKQGKMSQPSLVKEKQASGLSKTKDTELDKLSKDSLRSDANRLQDNSLITRNLIDLSSDEEFSLKDLERFSQEFSPEDSGRKIRKQHKELQDDESVIPVEEEVVAQKQLLTGLARFEDQSQVDEKILANLSDQDRSENSTDLVFPFYEDEKGTENQGSQSEISNAHSFRKTSRIRVDQDDKPDKSSKKKASLNEILNDDNATLPANFWKWSKEERFDHVVALVQEGMSIRDISDLTKMSYGEIELIASLNRNFAS